MPHLVRTRLLEVDEDDREQDIKDLRAEIRFLIGTNITLVFTIISALAVLAFR